MRLQGTTFGLAVCSSTQFVAKMGHERTNTPWTFVTINGGSFCIKAASSPSKSIADAGRAKARANSTTDQRGEGIGQSISDSNSHDKKLCFFAQSVAGTQEPFCR